MNAESLVIRKFQPQDRAAVRQICCETALTGRPSSIFLDDDEVFADALTLCFTDYEPQSCFVAESRGEVVGYLIGAKDEKVMEDTCRQGRGSALLGKAWKRGFFLHKKNLRFLFHLFGSLLKAEFRQPRIPDGYPAVLHINLKEGFRGQGAGGLLMRAYLNYLRQERVPGVHLATMSEKASAFFKKQGFELLHRGTRSYWRYILGKNVPVYIYGKRLSA